MLSSKNKKVTLGVAQKNYFAASTISPSVTLPLSSKALVSRLAFHFALRLNTLFVRYDIQYSYVNAVKANICIWKFKKTTYV